MSNLFWNCMRLVTSMNNFDCASCVEHVLTRLPLITNLLYMFIMIISKKKSESVI